MGGRQRAALIAILATLRVVTHTNPVHAL
ncbi:hypothetical protein ACLBP3_09825, partial [Klebsiella pneumoniae]